MLLVGVVWSLFKLVELALTAIVEACNTIATTYNGADSLVKFLILLAIGYVIYRVVRRAGRFS
jgi:hypothetical protein